MDLWSKGLGRRVLSMTLGERELLADSDGYLVIEGAMHAPTYWDYQVSLEEDDIVEFLELLQQARLPALPGHQPGQGQDLHHRRAPARCSSCGARSASPSPARPAARAEPEREITSCDERSPRSVDEDWDDAVVDWDQEDNAPTTSAGARAGTDDKEGRHDAGT